MRFVTISVQSDRRKQMARDQMNADVQRHVAGVLDRVLLEHLVRVALQVIGQRLQRYLQIIVEWAFESLRVI